MKLVVFLNKPAAFSTYSLPSPSSYEKTQQRTGERPALLALFPTIKLDFSQLSNLFWIVGVKRVLSWVIPVIKKAIFVNTMT